MGNIIPHDLFGPQKFLTAPFCPVNNVRTLAQDIVKSGLFPAKMAITALYYQIIVITG
jgi:hypothetical protein